MSPIDGRSRHYGDFYGVQEIEPDRPLLLVWGNCQAESLRVVLSGVPELPYRTVRVPPVHELTADDVHQVRRLAARTEVLVSQPVHTSYRDLPIGTADVAALLPRTGRVLRWPVVRYAGLEPFTVIVRDPDEPSANPPLVPYHDVRTLVQAARGAEEAPWDVEVDPNAFRAVAAASLAELQRREREQTDLAISDALPGLGVEAMHTINHPGNPVILELARRVLAALEVTGTVSDPGRTLLATTKAPLEARVLRALGLDAGATRPDWEHAGVRLSVAQVRAAQASWYADRPRLVAAGLARCAELLELLGIRVPKAALSP